MPISDNILQARFAEWGRTLDDWRHRSEEIGKDFFDRMERQYREVGSALDELQAKTGDDVEEINTRISKAVHDGQTRAERARLEAAAMAESASHAGLEIGHGFIRAWDGLQSSMDSAAQRMKRD